MPLDQHYTDDMNGRGPADLAPEPSCSIPEARQKTSKRGGPRPGFGGPQPGSGRPRKVIIPVAPAYAPDLPAWRVFATWGQAEISAARELARQGYETEMPLVAIRRRDAVIKSLWHEVRVPLFPGYGFIRLTQTQPREPVTATAGVRELLHRPDGRLSMVADRVVDALRADAEARLRLPKETAPVLAVGARVRITEGTFTDHAGLVLACDGVRTRVEIVLFERPTPLWVDRVALVEIGE